MLDDTKANLELRKLERTHWSMITTSYVIIDLRHQYGISDAESQTFFLPSGEERGETSVSQATTNRLPDLINLLCSLKHAPIDCKTVIKRSFAIKEGWNSKRLLRKFLFFTVKLNFERCCFIWPETLSKRHKEMICPEQLTPAAMSFAERLLSIGQPVSKSSLQYMPLNFQSLVHGGSS